MSVTVIHVQYYSSRTSKKKNTFISCNIWTTSSRKVRRKTSDQHFQADQMINRIPKKNVVFIFVKILSRLEQIQDSQIWLNQLAADVT